MSGHKQLDCALTHGTGISVTVEIARRASFNDFSGQKIYPDRIAPLLHYAAGRRALNVGCAGSDALHAKEPMHARISSVSSYCLGVDIYEAGVEAFRRRGLEVVVADAERMDLPRRDFEVALLGDVIEHVGNPGLVFDSVHRHLIDGGIAVVTTPNPFGLTLMLRRMLARPYAVNSEHVTWFDPVLLSYLMARSGFGEFEIFWTEASRYPPLRWLQGRNKSYHGTFGLVGRKLTKSSAV